MNKEAIVGDFFRLQGGFAYKSRDFTDKGVPVVKIGNITGGGFVDLSSTQFIPADLAEKTSEFLSEPGDILIAMTGANVGKVARVQQNHVKFAINQRVGRFVPKASSSLSKDFLYYFVASEESYQFFKNTAYGSAQPNISGKLIESLILPEIPVDVANRIGWILRTLDDKIALNRKLNETLEAIARALFQSWFVDFDPVKAKLAAVQHGRDSEKAAMAAISGKLRIAPGKPRPEKLEEQLPTAEQLDAAIAEVEGLTEEQRQKLAETAAHFPDGFVESELGLIPEGWEVATLGSICSQAIGGQWGADSQQNGLVPAICLRGCDMADITASGYAHRAPLRYIKRNALEKRLMNEKDLLIASSGAGPCGRPLWCSSSLSQERYGYPVIYSNFVKRFTFNTRKDAIFAEMILMPMYLYGSIGDYITGTSVPNLDSKGLLSGLKICLPSSRLRELYSEFYYMVDCKRSNKESRTLAELRDTLLPKLLSGELSVGEAAETLEAATEA